MKRLLLLCLLPFLRLPVRAAEPLPYAAPGPAKVATLEETWIDAARQREIPVKIYYSQTAAAPAPVIVFSHGLGGSRAGYEFLGRHWASRGYVCVHLQHEGSDETVWRGAPLLQRKARLRTAASPANVEDRALDVRFALTHLPELNRGKGALHGRLDGARVGVAGHSFGANTSLVVAGQCARGSAPALRDDRVRAVLAMSPPVTAHGARTDFSSVRIPVFDMTGTRDDSPIGETSAADRRIPFDRIEAANQYLLILNGGDHMVFGGRSFLRERPNDDAFHELIKASSTAFWDAYLRGDAKARAWLNGNDGFRGALGSQGTLETKNLR